MSELIATPVVKNKFWVVKESGNKIATIQAREDGGFVYVHDNQREYFDNVKTIKKKYKIVFSNTNKKIKSQQNHVYGFPVTGKSYNEIWDVKRKLPIFTKTKKSKSLYCAGYYLVKQIEVWAETFCPKNITISRYEYLGPFRTHDELKKFVRTIK